MHPPPSHLTMATHVSGPLQTSEQASLADRSSLNSHRAVVEVGKLGTDMRLPSNLRPDLCDPVASLTPECPSSSLTLGQYLFRSHTWLLDFSASGLLAPAFPCRQLGGGGGCTWPGPSTPPARQTRSQHPHLAPSASLDFDRLLLPWAAGRMPEGRGLILQWSPGRLRFLP